jgi:hypothetical protein
METVVFNNTIEEALSVPCTSVYEALSRALTAVMVHNGREYVHADIVAQRWHFPLSSYYQIPTWSTLKHDLEIAAKGSLEVRLKGVIFNSAQEDHRISQLVQVSLTNLETETLLELNKEATARGFRKRNGSKSKNYIQFIDEAYPKTLEGVKERAVLKARWAINSLQRQQADALDCQETRDWVRKCSHYIELVKDLKAIGVGPDVIEGYQGVLVQYRTQLDAVEVRYSDAIRVLECYVENIGLGVKILETT